MAEDNDDSPATGFPTLEAGGAGKALKRILSCGALAGVLTVALAAGTAGAGGKDVSARLEAWTKGTLDIHHSGR